MNSNMNSSSNFKVIVAGGGPVGLVAAHALTRAGIDFVVLESRQSIVIDAGSNLVLLPTGMRVLSQLGLLDALNQVSSPLSAVSRIDHEGHDLGDFNIFLHLKEK
jgi:2-polyprenyl-6-methoxyphenol hydroxylase-like FAD-dependent oxidoreductase